MSGIHRIGHSILRATGLEFWPVRVRRGIAEGARWTLYPSTAYWRGTHEPAMQAALAGLGEGNIDGWVCWDLGAHFGLYSIGLARRVGPGGQVAAFEPNPLSYRRLARHAGMNHVPWLKTFALAASESTGSAQLYTQGNLDSTVTHLPYDGEHLNSRSHPLAIETARLDDLLVAGALRPPDFVKIDVEGHGHRALAGMAGALRAHLPILTVAFHSPQEVEGVRALLDPLRYQARRIGSDPNPDWVGQDYLFTPDPGSIQTLDPAARLRRSGSSTRFS